LRRELGLAIRRYAEKYHSYAAVGRMWHLIYRKIWNGDSFEMFFWHPDRNSLAAGS
jgi:hypothetical protein